jgi:hypothetical protein
MPRILVATSEGLYEVGRDRTTVDLEGHAVGALFADGLEVWAVVDRGQIWATSGEGWSPFVAVEQLHISCLSLTDRLLFGTSSARLFSVVDGQATPLDGFDRAEGRGDWYTPWGGPPDTRSITEWDRDVYVNVHVGGILRTDDGGASWTPTIDIDADVHRVATAEGLVLAACAGGLATSTDRGSTWSMRDDGLAAPYMRGVTVCGDAVLVSTSSGPRGGRSGVYRGALRGGGAFERCTAGLPEWFDDNIDSLCLDGPPDGSFAAFAADGRVFGSDDGGATWGELASGLPAVHAVLVVP